MLSSAVIDNFPGVANPLGVIPATPAWDAIGGILFLTAFGVLVASAVALLLRLHRSRGDERLQRLVSGGDGLRPRGFHGFARQQHVD